jgi:S-DNA-T family DNA segregation ATPase FtsK/SpoIIIE
VLDLWTADQGVPTDPVAPWPLLTEGDADYFRGRAGRRRPARGRRDRQAHGQQLRHRRDHGIWQTALVINPGCGAMLDPLVDIDVYVMTFNVDYDPMRRLRTLVKCDEDEQIEAAIEALRT